VAKDKSALLESVASGPEKCYCGIRIPHGGAVLRVVPQSRSSDSLLSDKAFCSLNCIRTFCLESLETLESLDRPFSKAVARDLDEVHRELTETLAEIVDKSA
jgi:hypothetical protein